MGGWFGWANAVMFHVGSAAVLWSDALGSLCGLATVALAVKKSLLTWPVQILGCVLLFGASLAADPALPGNASRQVVVALAALYGAYRWVTGKRETGQVVVRWARGTERTALIAILAIGTFAFAALISILVEQFPNSGWSFGHPWSWMLFADAYIFMGSLVATLGQARGYVEFWFVWFAVDVVGVPLAFHSGLYFQGVVYVVYFILCCWGIRDWIRQAGDRADGPAQSPAKAPAALPPQR